MGEVYRARDTRLNRDVAIKTLPSHALTDPRFRERFDREARAIAALSHPNILAIFDIGEHEGVPYVATELLDGATLADRIDGALLPLRTAVDYAVQIARGVAAAHDRGIIHRDLKPANIFITSDDQAKVLDFGLATEPIAEVDASLETRPQTERGTMLGTVGYMSPEQARGEQADARSDIFSFGCVLYEMVSGTRAFRRETRIETLHAILKDHPADLIASGRDIPPVLDRLIMRCLAKSPAARFQTARDLVFALENVLDARAGSTQVQAPPVSLPARRWPVAAAAVMAVAIAGGVWWVVAHRPGPAPPGAAATPADDPRRLLAVLPFENITRDGKPGYFGAGMTEEVTSQLSKLSALRVVGRAAVTKFKDARSDLPVIVQELGVGSVVSGTVREDGSRVRVNVELMDTRSGQVIWSEQYDREATDVFAVQSDIALRIADALNASVTLDEQARVGKRPTSSVAAYQLFVRARTMRPVVREQLKGSIDLLRQAVALDPRFAVAYAELADRYYYEASFGDLSAIARGLEAAHIAIGIDPQLAHARNGLALNLQQLGRLGEALPAYRKAVELDPSYATGLTDLSYAEMTQGRFDEALKHARRGLQLLPNTAGAYYHVGVDLLFLDDDARTERFLTAAATRFPTYTRLHMLLAYLDLRRGQPKAALDRIRRAVDADPNNIEGLFTRAEIATLAGAADAPALVRSLLAGNANGLFGVAPYTITLVHAYHLHAGGSASEAAKLMDEILVENRKAVTGGADWPMVFMQNAAVHALRGEPAATLDWLDRAYVAGWRDGRTLAIDPLFASVRKEPRFAQLLSRIQADVAVMRARADYGGL